MKGFVVERSEQEVTKLFPFERMIEKYGGITNHRFAVAINIQMETDASNTIHDMIHISPF